MKTLFDMEGPAGGRDSGEALIVDSFAGGGGASTGIEMALGRSPDIAINHNADALAMHEVNHPDTLHLSKNIWHVDPLEAVGNRRVGLAWFSPDCKHFSKAKGGRPVKRSIRDLAWVVVLWARRVRPEVIMLENVEEFRDWGPVTAEGKPCKERKGQTFEMWTAQLKRLGYRMEWRELRACDYGAPTIRKRFFMIARRDVRPIVWPEPTHGKPDDPDVIAGRKQPWRTAAEIIDWSLPCPSIFDSAEEIMEKHGVRAIRPLADATMKRIARGVVRYVLEAKKPFFVTFAQQGGGNRSPDVPLHTVTASQKDQNALIVPSFVGCGGRAGQSPPRGGDQPTGTLTAKADSCIVAAHLTKFQTGSTGSGLDEPAPTVTANSYIKKPGGAAPIGVVAAHLSRFTQNGIGSGLDEPLDTVMAGAPKFGVVAAFLAQHSTGNDGHDARTPVSTITAGGAYGVSQQGIVAAHLSWSYTSNTRGGEGDLRKPAKTILAGGQHAALISGFLTKYYGTGDGSTVTDPMHTDTVKDRMGLVTVEIDGQTFAGADIGMRMLTPRERFRAQGFPDDYIIDRRPDGTPITATVQGSCCGNSVCPPLAEALVRANCGHLARLQEAAE
ncbi:MAG: DNA cytosine methyltransferase [Pararhodobacter sp.]